MRPTKSLKNKQMENETVNNPDQPKKEVPHGMIWIILVAVVIVAAIFFLIFWIGKETAKAPEVSYNASENEATDPAGESIESPEIATETKEAQSSAKTGAETVSIDSTWNKYTNYDLGFSINVPKQAASGYASCEFNSGEKSYRAKAGMVQIKTFEDASSGVVYIAPEYFYRLGGEKQNSSGVSTFSICTKIQNSVSEMKKSNELTEINYWKLTTQSTENDVEIESFLKSIFGTACKLGDKTQTSVAGVYDIKIDGVTDLDGACPMNAAYVFKYSQVKKLVTTWTTGQAYSFYTSTDYSNAHDEQMIDSFSFN